MPVFVRRWHNDDPSALYVHLPDRQTVGGDPVPKTSRIRGITRPRAASEFRQRPPLPTLTGCKIAPLLLTTRAAQFDQIALLHPTARCPGCRQQCREAVLCLRPRHCGRCDGTYIPKSLSDRYQRQIEAVSFKPRQLGPSNVGTPASTIPMGLRVLAIVLRALFMGALVVVVARVSGPQSETIWSVYETPGDLIRLALGFAMGLWIVIHLFMLPKNAEGYRTWVYLGLVVAPLALAVAIAIW